MSQNKLKVFGMSTATCVQRVATTAAENGVELELEFINIRKGEQKSAAHLARQPFGKIPALKDGDFTLYESRAISRYIDATRGSKLVPADPQARALMDQWASLEQGTFNPHLEGIAFQFLYAESYGGKTDLDAVKKHADSLAASFDIMEAHLASSAAFPFLSGAQFSLADIFFLPFLRLLLLTPEARLVTSRPHVHAWYNRCTARPAWKKAVAAAEKEQADVDAGKL